MRTADEFTALFDAKLAAQKWIVCTDVAAVFTPLMGVFKEVGAPRPLLLAGSAGTGPQPDPEECELIILGTTSDTMLGGIRVYHQALRNLSPQVIARIEQWDPDQEALVMASFLDTRLEIAGRPSWGARPEAWLDLEDKMIIDAVWDAAGIARAPSEIVAASPQRLMTASNRIDLGAGVVWTADNRDGWHGGAEYSRYIADAGTADEALEFMINHAHRVRVMPFLEGVPCAIHAMVFPDYVAAFRPVEMVVFRQPDSQNFRYASCATSWDPSPTQRDEMRQVAHIAGTHLREVYNFKGALTVDGVLTEDGFRPTELNPRYGAGLFPVARGSGLPLLGFSRMLIEEEADGLDGRAIESLAIEAADANRTLAGFTTTSIRIDETEDLRVLWNGDSVRPADGDNANGTLTRGPATHGSLVRFTLDADAIPVGILAAPIVALAFGLADELWDMGIGELIPATPA